MSLSPWEELPYFQRIKETTVSVGASPATQIVEGNPQRVALVLGVASGGNPVNISTRPDLATNQGILIGSTFSALVLLQKDVGPLVASPWFAVAGFAGTAVTAIEVLLQSWPQEDNTSLPSLIVLLAELIRTLRSK
jgi:hypothetical protein